MPPSGSNGDKSYNCREETLRAIKHKQSSAGCTDADPERTLIHTFESSPRTPTGGRVVLVADHGSRNGGLRWNSQSSVGRGRQLLPPAATSTLVSRAGMAGCTDQTLSTFGRTLPLPTRTLIPSTDDVNSSSTPDVKVRYQYPPRCYQ